MQKIVRILPRAVMETRKREELGVKDITTFQDMQASHEVENHVNTILDILSEDRMAKGFAFIEK